MVAVPSRQKNGNSIPRSMMVNQTTAWEEREHSPHGRVGGHVNHGICYLFAICEACVRVSKMEQFPSCVHLRLETSVNAVYLLLNVPATCLCISRKHRHRQFNVLPR